MNTYEFITDEEVKVRAPNLQEAMNKAGIGSPVIVFDVTSLMRHRHGSRYLIHVVDQVSLVAYDIKNKTVVQLPLVRDIYGNVDQPGGSNGFGWWQLPEPSKLDLNAEDLVVYLTFSSWPVTLSLHDTHIRPGEMGRFTTDRLSFDLTAQPTLRTCKLVKA